MSNAIGVPPVDMLIIGGGFFGASIAIALRRMGCRRVVICERESRLGQRASLRNQARIHNGYHYPRDFVTAVRSHANYHRFLKEYASCIYDRFDHYYAIARQGSKVSAKQFWNLFRQMEAPIEVAPAAIRGLFDEYYIEEVFRVQEVMFDSCKLMDHVKEVCERLGVEIFLDTEVRYVRQTATGLEVDTCDVRTAEHRTFQTAHAFNVTYARINTLLRDSNLPPIVLQHEITELALVDIPPRLERFGVTVMDGEFFSLIPFPTRGLTSLSHVRYTPHFRWTDDGGEGEDVYNMLDRYDKRTHYPLMIQDATRYIPSLEGCLYRDSIWEVKAILPRNEENDGRPILVKKDHGIAGLHCIMGGKIDNIYDILQELPSVLASSIPEGQIPITARI